MAQRGRNGFPALCRRARERSESNPGALGLEVARRLRSDTSCRMSEPGEKLDQAVSTAQLADSLDGVGRRNQVMDAAIVPLADGARAAGRAATVQFAAVDHDTDDPYD